MSKLLDRHFDATTKLRYIAMKIQRLSRSFYTTGNNYIGDRLSYFAEDICATEKELTAVFRESLDKEYKKAQEHTATILNAALAGISLVTREGGDNE